MNIASIIKAVCSQPLPKEPFIAALPMYDWPEQRAQVDALWQSLRAAFLAIGIKAPENLVRCNADLPNVDLPPNQLDLATLWRHPNLLFGQTCWGPLEAGLLSHVRIVGQEDYTGIEGGNTAQYTSAIVMNVKKASGIKLMPTTLHKLLSGKRLAINEHDSMSGYLALVQDLENLGANINIIAELIISGGHRNSICMVANGEADVAAIDCKSWALAKTYEAKTGDLVVVGWTKPRLGLPFITARPQ